jgi:protein-tyrosine phosphatase
MRRPHHNTYWIEPSRFLAGEYPGASESATAAARLAAYLDCGVTDFIDLTTPGELVPYEPLLEELADSRHTEIGYRRMPIVDMSVPRDRGEMKAILDEIDRRISRGGTVYVHCWGGIGRTGTVAGCYLVRQGLTGDAALLELARLWPQMQKSAWYQTTPQTPEQYEYVRHWTESGHRSVPGDD